MQYSYANVMTTTMILFALIMRYINLHLHYITLHLIGQESQH